MNYCSFTTVPVCPPLNVSYNVTPCKSVMSKTFVLTIYTQCCSSTLCPHGDQHTSIWNLFFILHPLVCAAAGCYSNVFFSPEPRQRPPGSSSKLNAQTWRHCQPSLSHYWQKIKWVCFPKCWTCHLNTENTLLFGRLFSITVSQPLSQDSIIIGLLDTRN